MSLKYIRLSDVDNINCEYVTQIEVSMYYSLYSFLIDLEITM